MKVNWLHESEDFPVLLYSEIVDGWETRKVDVYRHRRVDFASEQVESGETALGLAPVPSKEEIAQQAEFLAEEISADDFDKIWQRAPANRLP